ncbi:hypothetical protein B0O99DRAFT_144601 [Bisporella sp. PMI_857]|nr:hypothetical protein B0O99DRAFT_144601 [Bisporella sp. PMI_857]
MLPELLKPDTSRDLLRKEARMEGYDRVLERRCMACTLASIGGHAAILTDLRASLVGRRTRRRFPVLLPLVDAWVARHADPEGVMARSKEMGRKMGRARRELQRRRREERSRGEIALREEEGKAGNGAKKDQNDDDEIPVPSLVGDGGTGRRDAESSHINCYVGSALSLHRSETSVCTQLPRIQYDPPALEVTPPSPSLEDTPSRLRRKPGEGWLMGGRDKRTARKRAETYKRLVGRTYALDP